MKKFREKKLECNRIKWSGIVKLKKKENVFFVNKTHKFEIVYKNERFIVEIDSIKNQKEIAISSDNMMDFKIFEELLLEILRFENIFDGCFYSFKEFKIDERNVERRRIDWVPYFFSKKRYMDAWVSFDDSEEYKKFFSIWLELNNELGIIHQMFLYSKYAMDITPDVKMALLLQTFEPMADILKKKGKISLPKKISVVNKKVCTNCNNEITISYEKEIDFKHKLKAIIDTYGTYIFANEAKDKLLDKAVNTRNKIVHLNAGKKNTMSGPESGFYLYKFELLYRIIVLSELGFEENVYLNTFIEWVKDFDKRYNDHIIGNK